MPPGFTPYRRSELRQQQRVEARLVDQFVVGSFGIFVPDKHLEDCLSAFARLAKRHPQARYILNGRVVEDYDLHSHVRSLGLDRQVMVTGWRPPLEFARHMFALDVGIHLRYPHIGGTPYTPIRLMGLGVATIVSDIEPLAELPQGACVKIAPDAYQENTLAAVLEYLADHPEFCQQISENGRRFIAANHDVDQIARQYIEFAQSLI